MSGGNGGLKEEEEDDFGGGGLEGLFKLGSSDLSGFSGRIFFTRIWLLSCSIVISPVS